MEERRCYYESKAGIGDCPRCDGDIETPVLGAKANDRVRIRLKEMREKNVFVGVCSGHEQYAREQGLKLE